MVCIFVMALTTVIVVSMLDSQVVDMAVLRNTTDYERALYLAGSGVHHALAELEADQSWRTGIPSTEFPASSGNTYSATVVDGLGNTVVVTGTGVAGGVTRQLQVEVDMGS